jgi:hypothetical protein
VLADECKVRRFSFVIATAEEFPCGRHQQVFETIISYSGKHDGFERCVEVDIAIEHRGLMTS